MGVCFDCIVTIDGVQGQRSCMTTVRSGMQIEVADHV
jgi:predicted molibdopterin-dependent oxidoreductase YjgC